MTKFAEIQDPSLRLDLVQDSPTLESELSMAVEEPVHSLFAANDAGDL
jgi:hypothetical protein